MRNSLDYINYISLYKILKKNKEKEESSKLTESIKKGIKDIKEGKVTEITNVDKYFEDFKEERRKHPIWYTIRGWYWRAYYIITGIPLRIRTFLQRGKNGIADSDIWNLNYHLSDVMIKGLKYIKEYGMGVPTWKDNMEEGQAVKQWHEILDTLIWTFEIAKKISDGDVIYLRNVKDRKRWREICKRINKKHPGYENRVMTSKEIRKYDRGWALFKTHYYSLWD